MIFFILRNLSKLDFTLSVRKPRANTNIQLSQWRVRRTQTSQKRQTQCAGEVKTTFLYKSKCAWLFPASTNTNTESPSIFSKAICAASFRLARRTQSYLRKLRCGHWRGFSAGQPNIHRKRDEQENEPKKQEQFILSQQKQLSH